ncbi:hypothetical protein LCGC14_0916130 [marine sediment metagenome]|uniref:Uncharacterized protein n=1 Tax=marine sediment metagenome TaxID=412755 RepID=A0A0F9PD03_9ZZZZ
MTVKEAIEKLQKVNPNAKLVLIQEEELECMPKWWDSRKNKVYGRAKEIYSEDLHSHQMYLLAIE